MASQDVTVTAPVGPGQSVTSFNLASCDYVKFDAKNEVIEIKETNGKIHHFEYETVATVTYTVSGEVATVTIST